MKIYKSYLFLTFALAGILSLIVAISNGTLLNKSGEYLSPDQIYYKQSESNSLNVYGSAISDKAVELKLAAYEILQPAITAVGSSRTLQFRQAFFQRSFYNMGLTAGSVDELHDIIDKMLALHKPEIIVIGADFWWFHPKNERKKEKLEIDWYAPYLNQINNLALPLQWIYEKSIQPADYLKLLLSTPQNHIGVRGKLRNAGIAPDGSYYYTDRVNGDHINDKEQFSETLERIERNEAQFIKGRNASHKLIKEFGDIVSKLQSKGIEVIVFFPPLAPRILRELRALDYTYIDEIDNIFLDEKIPYHDFLDPAEIGLTTDCEFIDGFHGGDVLYGRIIRQIAKSNKALAEAADLKYLEKVEKYKGKAMIPESRLTEIAETDFLKLGCKK